MERGSGPSLLFCPPCQVPHHAEECAQRPGEAGGPPDAPHTHTGDGGHDEGQAEPDGTGRDLAVKGKMSAVQLKVRVGPEGEDQAADARDRLGKNSSQRGEIGRGAHDQDRPLSSWSGTEPGQAGYTAKR